MVEQNNNNENVKNEGFFNSLKNNVSKVLDKVLQFVPEYLRSRFIPAIIMSILAIIILYSPLFNLCILAIAILMAFEWILISQNEDVNNKWKEDYCDKNAKMIAELTENLKVGLEQREQKGLERYEEHRQAISDITKSIEKIREVLL